MFSARGIINPTTCTKIILFALMKPWFAQLFETIFVEFVALQATVLTQSSTVHLTSKDFMLEIDKVQNLLFLVGLVTA